jgi:hypothetical protein
MKALFKLSILLATLWPALLPAQDVLVPGDPPLTTDLVAKYSRFMQWTLGAPLTLAQEARIRDYLVENWKSDDKGEIHRALNIIALREQIEALKLQDEPWAAESMRKEALRNWRGSSALKMSQWGMSIFDSAHRPLVTGTPPLTRQMEDAYEELGYFMMREALGTEPVKLFAEQRVGLADALGGAFASMSPEQKANFAKLPEVWVQIRAAWAGLTDAQKADLRKDWKSRLSPAPAVAKKGAKPQPAAPEQTVLSRLTDMKWVLEPSVFEKLSAVGTPYGKGW